MPESVAAPISASTTLLLGEPAAAEMLEEGRRMSFEQARACIVENVARLGAAPPAAEVPLDDADGRVTAEAVHADRDHPAVALSVRDGFAVRAADTPGRLRLAGESRAGVPFVGQVAPGEAVEIMTGASMPAGADAVVMVEYARREDGYVVAPAAEAAAGLPAKPNPSRESTPK